MRLAFVLALPLLALAQSSQPPPQNTNNQASQLVVTSTSIQVVATLGPDRQASSLTRTLVFTTTLPLTPQITGNATASNGTVSGNSTISANSTSAPPRTLPTAPTNIDAGGINGAPSPGQTSVNGIFGPGDDYFAAATALKRNAFVVGFVGVAVGGALLVL